MKEKQIKKAGFALIGSGILLFMNSLLHLFTSTANGPALTGLAGGLLIYAGGCLIQSVSEK